MPKLIYILLDNVHPELAALFIQKRKIFVFVTLSYCEEWHKGY